MDTNKPVQKKMLIMFDQKDYSFLELMEIMRKLIPTMLDPIAEHPDIGRVDLQVLEAKTKKHLGEPITVWQRKTNETKSS